MARRHIENMGMQTTMSNWSEPSSQEHHHQHEDATTKEYFEHSSAKRVNTDSVVASTLKKQYPNLELVITPVLQADLRAYAHSGFADYEPIEDSAGDLPASLQWDQYIPPARRLDGALGVLGERTLFAKYIYKWKDSEFVVYLVDGRDGSGAYPPVLNYYILTNNKPKALQLILEAGRWGADLHDEVWVFDRGYWQKSKELYDSIRNATWDSVILDEEMKKSIVEDHLSFFNSRDTYEQLKVPWKRGIIYYGPPGNGKTISIKAMMHTLYSRKPAVPTLYVRSLSSVGAISVVFGKAREFAPCYLVFEDLDSIVSDNVRSYFLNEVDGLKSNDGVFMVGSTNHLDRLDPGISKRPSRFDRKYFFPDPNLDERIAYCHFWQQKLADNQDIDFPDELCKAIAEITDKFSFAYMQEAFVAALLAIARRSKEKTRPTRLEGLMHDLGDGWVGIGGGGEDLEHLVLWVEIKKQVETLREGMDEKERVRV